jgi:S-adenosylmethionine synthetase
MNSTGSYSFTSESVGEGHPDKLCDQISDAIVDAALENDPNSRVACETFTTTGMVLVGGEITTTSHFDAQQIARDVLRDVGYDDPDFGIDYKTCAVLNTIHGQSADIAMGVDVGDDKVQGAGDQGLMFGYACSDTPHLMPAPIDYSHTIMMSAARARHERQLPFLAPDGKCQVTVQYEEGTPIAIDTVVLSHQHTEDVSNEQLREALIEEVIKPVLPAEMIANATYLINPTGRFVIGGPHGDAGLTGRKIIVDTYGGMARHGGGAFSGKDPSKVDRSAAYMARYIAKNIVASGLCGACEVQLAYAIGVADPVSVYVHTFGSGAAVERRLEAAAREVFDLTPAGIIATLDLRKPIYRPTATYGHFGRDQFSWERVDRADAIKAAVAG